MVALSLITCERGREKREEERKKGGEKKLEEREREVTEGKHEY